MLNVQTASMTTAALLVAGLGVGTGLSYAQGGAGSGPAKATVTVRTAPHALPDDAPDADVPAGDLDAALVGSLGNGLEFRLAAIGLGEHWWSAVGRPIESIDIGVDASKRDYLFAVIDVVGEPAEADDFAAPDVFSSYPVADQKWTRTEQGQRLLLTVHNHASHETHDDHEHADHDEHAEHDDHGPATTITGTATASGGTGTSSSSASRSSSANASSNSITVTGGAALGSKGFDFHLHEPGFSISMVMPGDTQQQVEPVGDPKSVTIEDEDFSPIDGIELSFDVELKGDVIVERVDADGTREAGVVRGRSIRINSNTGDDGDTVRTVSSRLQVTFPTATDEAATYEVLMRPAQHVTFSDLPSQPGDCNPRVATSAGD